MDLTEIIGNLRFAVVQIEMSITALERLDAFRSKDGTPQKRDVRQERVRKPIRKVEFVPRRRAKAVGTEGRGGDAA